MHAVFYFPQGTTLRRGFVTDSFSVTEIYHNNLSPADNSATAEFVWDALLSDLLKTFDKQNIRVEIKNDDLTNYFSGYLRKTYSFGKKQRNQLISIEIVSPSFLLRKKLPEFMSLQNATAAGIIRELLRLAGFFDVGPLPISATLPVFWAKSGDEIYALIAELCFEYGYIFDFDRNGFFQLYPLFNEPPEPVVQAFNGSNCYDEISQRKNEEEHQDAHAKWPSLAYLDGADARSLVWQDQSGATADKDADIVLPPHSYYGGDNNDEEFVYLDYDSTVGEVLCITAVTLAITAPGAQGLFSQNLGTRLKISLYNPTSRDVHITQFQVYGQGYVKTADNVSKTGNSENPYEHDFSYIFYRQRADAIVRQVANYYRYSDFTVSLQSKADYPLGSFCTVTDYGIGTVTGRIVQKKYGIFDKIIDYEIEAVSEYTPAPESELELNIGSENTFFDHSTDSDVTPPSVPEILSVEHDSRARVTVTFSQAGDAQSGVMMASIYRADATSELPPRKLGETMQGMGLFFVDETAFAGMRYVYYVSATDHANNESALSDGVAHYVSVYAPANPVTQASAVADKSDYISLSWLIPETNPDGKNAIDFYRLWISRDAEESWQELASVNSTSLFYYYNRAEDRDWYPEREDLEKYRFRIRPVSVYGVEALQDMTVPVRYEHYGTWKPGIPQVSVRAGNRNVSVVAAGQYEAYGTNIFDLQIAKQFQADDSPVMTDLDDAANWHAPSLDDRLARLFGAALLALLAENNPDSAGYMYRYGDFEQAWHGVQEFLTSYDGAWYGTMPLDQRVVQVAAGGDGGTDRLFGGNAATQTFARIISGGSAHNELATLLSGGDAFTDFGSGAAGLRLATVALDTVFYMRARGRNLETGHVSNYGAPRLFAVTATDAIDVVRNAINTAAVQDGAIVARKIFVESLAAICADLGMITDGALANTENNYWILTSGWFPSDPMDPDSPPVYRYAGDFSVGTPSGDFFKCRWDPLSGKYHISFAASTFVITALGSIVKIKGDGGFYVCAEGTPIVNDVPTSWFFRVGTDGAQFRNPVQIENETNSTSPTTGALTVKGGVGIAKDAWVAGMAALTRGDRRLYATGESLEILENEMKHLYTSWAAGLLSLTLSGTLTACNVIGTDSVSVNTPGVEYITGRVGTETLNGITYGTGKWVAVGDSGSIAYGIDGVHWTIKDIGIFSYSAIIYAAGKFVAVGEGYAYSADGVSWTQSTHLVGKEKDGVAYDGGKFVAVGDNGSIAYSTDGVSWTEITVGTRNWRGVAYGGGKLVAVGYNGSIAYNTDGVSWTQITVGTKIWRGVAYGGGKFIAVGDNGNIACSTDGVSWTQDTVGTRNWRGVAYADSKFVVVGNEGSIAYSADGMIWDIDMISTQVFLRGVFYSQNKICFVGYLNDSSYNGYIFAIDCNQQYSRIGFTLQERVAFVAPAGALAILEKTAGIQSMTRVGTGRYRVYINSPVFDKLCAIGQATANSDEEFDDDIAPIYAYKINNYFNVTVRDPNRNDYFDPDAGSLFFFG